MKEAREVEQKIPNQNIVNLVNLALSMGALEAKLMDVKDIVVRDWVRLKCQYGCGAYGKILTCPPYSPTPEQTRNILSGYTTAILLRLPDESRTNHVLIAKLERSLFLEGYYSAFGLPAGPCEYCEKCNLKHCVKPKLARPTMEACGIDVYATVRKNGFDIDVRKTTEEKPTYFGLVLVE